MTVTITEHNKNSVSRLFVSSRTNSELSINTLSSTVLYFNLPIKIKCPIKVNYNIISKIELSPTRLPILLI